MRSKEDHVFRPATVILLQHRDMGQEIEIIKIFCAGGTAADARLAFDAYSGGLHGLCVDAPHRARRGARPAFGAQGAGGQGARF